jgi:hypothetical protein
LRPKSRSVLTGASGSGRWKTTLAAIARLLSKVIGSAGAQRAAAKARRMSSLEPTRATFNASPGRPDGVRVRVGTVDMAGRCS